MAASMLGRRTAMFRWVYRGVSSSKTVIPEISQCGLLLQIANYNPKPLRLNIKDPYIPDKDNVKTPEWQKTAKNDRKLYGRYGSASGIDPATLWPSHAQLEEIIADENQWHPPLEVMQKNIADSENAVAAIRLTKAKLVADNMAKMPKMIDDWRREKRETRRKTKEEAARRQKLLTEARERFGYAMDPRSPRFLEMVAEIDKEEKKKKKLVRRHLTDETGAPPPPAATSSS